MTLKRIVFLVFIVVLAFSLTNCGAGARKAKNIVIMVPDGMGIADVTAARIYKYGNSSERLHFEKLEQIGYQSTHSANSTVTDSAAAASAWACGEKFVNGEISFHKKTEKFPKSILELAKETGKSTGLVATSTITHATPGAFGAHVGNRKCERKIAGQYLTKTGVDVLLGGGKKVFVSTEEEKDACGVYGDFIKVAKENGYKYITTRGELNGSTAEKKLLGLFTDGGMTPMVEKTEKESEEPTLAEMTGTALKILEKNEEGFFMLVEGSQVDWANHQHKLEYQIGETLAFNDAVKVVLDWINADKSRKRNTLLIVVPDHDTAGFAVKGPYGKLIEEPGQYVDAGWVSSSHTAEDTIIWSRGPYSQHLGRAIDNTDVFHIMKAALYGEEYPGK